MTSHSSVNMMQSSNLGIVFGPTLLRSGVEEPASKGLMNPMNSSSNVITTIIDDYSLIFDDENLFISPDKAVPLVSQSSPAISSLPKPPQRISGSQQNQPVDNAKIVPKFKPPPFKPRGVLTSSSPAAYSRENTEKEKDVTSSPLRSIAQSSDNNSNNSNNSSLIHNNNNSNDPPIPPSKPTRNENISNNDINDSSLSRRVPPSRKSLPPQHGISKPAFEHAIGLYDFNGDYSVGQMPFKAGAVIRIVSKHQSGWWTGILDGKKGLIPKNFLYTN